MDDQKDPDPSALDAGWELLPVTKAASVDEAELVDAGWDEPVVASPLSLRPVLTKPSVAPPAPISDEIDEGWDAELPGQLEESTEGDSTSLRRRKLTKKERRTLLRQRRAHAEKKRREQKQSRREVKVEAKPVQPKPTDPPKATKPSERSVTEGRAAKRAKKKATDRVRPSQTSGESMKPPRRAALEAPRVESCPEERGGPAPPRPSFRTRVTLGAGAVVLLLLAAMWLAR